jgi:thiol-disulfide isomerase/thioredoxin
MKKNIGITSCIITFALFELICLSAEPINWVGREMPRFTVKNWLSKETLNSRDLQDRIYVIEFWATWCPTCVKTMPHLNELAQKYRQDEVLFITFSRDRSAKEVFHFMKEKNINLYAAMAGGIDDKLGVSWIPIAYVVGHNGKVLWQGNPASEAFDVALEKTVKSAPPAFLKDVDLGPYEHLRFQLSGCTGFSKAYRTLQMEVRKDKSKDAYVAAEIIKSLDAKINIHIEQIRSIQDNDPQAAILLYHKLISRFRGSEPINQARAEYEKLKNSLNGKEDSQATNN